MTQNKGLVLDLVDYCEKLEKAGKILPCGYENKIAQIVFIYLLMDTLQRSNPWLPKKSRE